MSTPAAVKSDMEKRKQISVRGIANGKQLWTFQIEL